MSADGHIDRKKKIAIIIISIILALVILLPTGLYIFGIFIVPHMINGESIKAEYIDNPVMSVSWQKYDKQKVIFTTSVNGFT